MGIKKFKEVFEHHTVLTAKDLKGLTIAIDASYEIYRGLKSTIKIHTMSDKDGNPTNYVKIILGVIRAFYNAGVNQIWVFDNPRGNPHKVVNAQRRAQREKIVAKMEDLKRKKGEVLSYEDDEKLRQQLEDPLFEIPKGMKTEADDEISKLQKQAFTINSQMITRIKRILDAFQIPHVEAPYEFEAEGVCAHLTKIGVADAVFTNDPDALLYGAKKLIMRNPTDKSLYVQYNLNILLEKEEWTQLDFIHFGIMLGCDFYDDHPQEGEENSERPHFAGFGPKKKLRRLSIHQRAGTFNKPYLAIAVEQFTKPLPALTIQNEEFLKNVKGSRPFSSSRTINKLIKWMVQELGFEEDPLVKLMKKTFKLSKIHGIKLKKDKAKDIANGGD